MALDAAEWRFASEFAWDDGGTTSPPLDTQPDDLIELIGSYSSDVLEPSHLGRLARTSTCMRQLLAVRRALKAIGTLTKAAQAAEDAS